VWMGVRYTVKLGVFKARAQPLTTAVVASILHKVDNDLRRIPEGQELPSVGTGPSPGARFEWKVGRQSDWFEPEKSIVTLQEKKCPFPSFDAPPRSSSFVVEDKDYVPDDRDPDFLIPLSVRETERYAYLEDDFDAYLGTSLSEVFHKFRGCRYVLLPHGGNDRRFVYKDRCWCPGSSVVNPLL
jgi:hypothetical protein